MLSGNRSRKQSPDQFGADKFEIRRIEFVGPKIGEDLRSGGHVGCRRHDHDGIYIWLRFSSGSASAPSLR